MKRSKPKGWLPCLGAIIIGLGAAFLGATGYGGVGRSGSAFGAQDFVYVYTAGRVWLQGDSPYDQDLFRKVGADVHRGSGGEESAQHLSSAMAYPPPASVFFSAIALLPPDAARIAFGVINAMSVFVLARFAVGAARRNLPANVSPRGAALAGALALGAAVVNPFISHNIWMGQTTLLAVAMVVLSWEARESGRSAMAGALLGASMFKPQLGIVVVVIYALERDRCALLLFLLTTAILALPAFLASGPLAASLGWLNAVQDYQQARQNMPAFRHSFGVRSVLPTWSYLAPALVAIGVLAIIALFIERRRFSRDLVFGLALATSLLFLHAHDYDLLALIPLVATLAGTVAGSIARLIMLAVVIAVLYVPLRFVMYMELPVLTRWRECVVVGLAVWGVCAGSKLRSEQTHEHT